MSLVTTFVAAGLSDVEDAALLAPLRRATTRSKGFTLLIAVCNSPARRDRLITALSSQLSRPLAVLQIEPGCEDVLAAALELHRADPQSPLAIVGIESGIRYSDFAHPRIGVLNQRREEWRDFIPVPVVLWVPEYLLRPLALGAPDFLDWRAGTFLFVDDPDLPVEVMRMPDDLNVSQMTKEERQQRIDELRTLINHFSAPPHEAEEAVNRWRLELARQLQSAGDWQEAIHVIQQELLPSCVTGPDDRLCAHVWGELADVLQARGELDEALRIRREEQLPVYERLGDERERAVTLGKVADVLQARGELDEALRIRREEQLPVFERLGDVRSRAVTLGRISDVLQKRGELDEALRIRREEQLPVYKRLGDVRSRAITMGKIADVLQKRGELDEAQRIRREEELPVYERLGDVRSRAITLGKIADVLQKRGELDEALRILREEVLPVLERLGDVRSCLVSQSNIALALLARGAVGDRDVAVGLLHAADADARRLRLPEAEHILAIQQHFGLES